MPNLGETTRAKETNFFEGTGLTEKLIEEKARSIANNHNDVYEEGTKIDLQMRNINQKFGRKRTYQITNQASRLGDIALKYIENPQSFFTDLAAHFQPEEIDKFQTPAEKRSFMIQKLREEAELKEKEDIYDLSGNDPERTLPESDRGKPNRIYEAFVQLEILELCDVQLQVLERNIDD